MTPRPRHLPTPPPFDHTDASRGPRAYLSTYLGAVFGFRRSKRRGARTGEHGARGDRKRAAQARCNAVVRHQREHPEELDPKFLHAYARRRRFPETAQEVLL